MKKDVTTVSEILKKQKLLQKKTFNVSDLAEYTGFSRSYIYKLTHRREIPYYCPSGKLIFFKRSEIDTWLLRNKRKSKEEIEKEAQLHLSKIKKSL